MKTKTLEIIHELLKKAAEEKKEAKESFRIECDSFMEKNGLARLPKDLEFKSERLWQECSILLNALDDFEGHDFH